MIQLTADFHLGPFEYATYHRSFSQCMRSGTIKICDLWDYKAEIIIIVKYTLYVLQKRKTKLIGLQMYLPTL